MDLNELRAIGAIVPRTLVKRTIHFEYDGRKPESEWADPDIPELTGERIDGSADVFIRRATSADALEIANAADRERPFVAIHRCICNPDGSEYFASLEDAMQLAMFLALPMFTAIQELNGVGPKKSPPATSSGASSRSGSAGEASVNGRPLSRSMKSRRGGSIESGAAP